jgi:predicted ester cyclase
VYRWTFHGTLQGDFFGIPATGKGVTITGMGISRIENGKIVELWSNFDQLGLMQQLGVIPPMG